ncbi:hypothetical protein LCGC14_1383550, partial [marine sediment metagenome]
IVGSSSRGDRYPEIYLERNGRLRPSDFSSSVLNSGIGHCSVVFGLRGPQVQVSGSPTVTELTALAGEQLRAGRADLMVIVKNYADNSASASVLSHPSTDGRRRR